MTGGWRRSNRQAKKKPLEGGSSTAQPLPSLDDFIRAAERVRDLPPIEATFEVTKAEYEALRRLTEPMPADNPFGFPSTLFGLELVIKDDN